MPARRAPWRFALAALTAACIVKLEIAMMRVLIQSVDGSAGIPGGGHAAALERITR